MPDRLCTTRIEAGGIAVLAIAGCETEPRQRLLEGVKRHFHSLAANDAVKGIVVTGSSLGFCRSSSDHSASPAEAAGLSAFGQKVMFSIEQCGKPVVAAVDGDCAGVGFELALACSFIVASDTSRFGFPAIADGLIPFCGGTQRLARLVGTSKAKEIIFSGDMLTAAEALRVRLVNRLFAAQELVLLAVGLLERICRNSPRALRVGGEVVDAGYAIDLPTACLLERNAFALCFSSADQREGMQAFLDKRQPQFTGE
ncbi:MAG: enoyl-CoA hydratase-related protein [Desulfuromonadales bacterium]